VKKATPISQKSLRRMVETCDAGTLRDCRDHLLLVLGMGLMGRRSELVALNVDDVVEVDEGLLIYIAMSKTDKAAEGEEVAIEPGTYPGTDPVRALRRWREALASRGELRGRLLRGLRKGGHLLPSLSTEHVNKIVRERARLAELPNWQTYSAHSLRAGGLTSALQQGALLGVAARHGRWKDTSPVVNGYARMEDRWRDNPMRGVL
jgi:integrase